MSKKNQNTLPEKDGFWRELKPYMKIGFKGNMGVLLMENNPAKEPTYYISISAFKKFLKDS